MSFRRNSSRQRLALWVRVVACSSALATAIAGEKMVESAPSKERPKLSSPTPGIDPILDRVLNPNGTGSGAGVGGMQSMPIIPTVRPGLDPLSQKRLGQQIDKRRNWLLENAAQINGLGQIREKETDDTPRFSQPGGGFATKGIGERLLRATDTSSGGELQRDNRAQDHAGSNSSENPDRTEAERETAAEASRAVPFRSRNGESDGRLTGQASEVPRSGKEVFSDTGPFSNPGRSLLDDTRRSAADERSAVFDRLLSGSSASTEASATGSGLNSLGLSQSTPSRAQRLQSLLTGPEPAVPSANAFGNPFSASTAVKPSASLADRVPGASLGPIGPPAPQRPASVRMEPRPALLQIPTRGF